VDKEILEHVCLIETIYIEPLALCEPTKHEIRIFEEEKKGRELEEELEVALKFLRKIMTSTTIVEPQVIVISDS
jgi:hypothetical protein